MTKHSYWIWLSPVVVWGVYMCWLSGFRSGYEQGHGAAWQAASQSFAIVTQPLPHHYQSPTAEDSLTATVEVRP